MLKQPFSGQLPPGSFKKSHCSHHTWANKIRVSGRRTQVSLFLKVPPSDYHLQPSLRTCCLSPKILGYGMGMRVFKSLCDGGYYCYFHSIMFPYIITMGRRKRNCLSLNTSRREQCYFETRGKSSWNCLKLNVRKTNHYVKETELAQYTLTGI